MLKHLSQYTYKNSLDVTKNIIDLDVSTSTGSLHEKNENITSSSSSWHSKY